MTDSILDIFSSVTAVNSQSSEMRYHGFRLDAGFFNPDKISAENRIKKSGMSFEPLKKIAHSYNSNIRGRIFTDQENGVALLTGRNLDITNEDDFDYVSKDLTPQIETEQLQSEDILMSCQGTIGKLDYVWQNHETKIASQQLIRIRAYKEIVDPGYLYTVLASPLAQSIITNQSAGSVIEHLSTDLLDSINVPRLSKESEKVIGDYVRESFSARADAREILNAADSLIHEVNSLLKLLKKETECYDPERSIESVIVSSSGVLLNNHSGSEYRLDAHYYNPLAQLAIKNIGQSKSVVKTIDKVTERVFMCGRFKRNYVEEEYGVPFLSGKNIIQIRPTDLKYLSKSETTDLDEYILEKKWTLITCSGTIGRTCFVWNNYENYAATQHIIRAVPNEEVIDPGYLYAFLSSPYGKQQVLRFRHGSVIDEVTDRQIKKVLIPLPSETDQKTIGDLVRSAYEKRAEAIRLIDEAQQILMVALTQ